LLSTTIGVAQSLNGMTGLFNIPTAHMQDDGTLMLSAHYMDRDYGAYKYSKDAEFDYDALTNSATVTFLPWLEAQFRYTHLLGREISQAESYFPDRMMSVRVQAFDGSDREWWPSVVIGFEDIAAVLGASSPSYYASNYLVLSRRFDVEGWKIDATLGYGFSPKFPWMTRTPSRLQQKGLFGGIAIGHAFLRDTELLIEHDSYRWNVATRTRLFGRWQLLAGLYAGRAFGGGLAYRQKL
jgi:hypothetical protein